MFNLEFDQRQNKLYLHLSGVFDVKQGEQLYAQLHQNIFKLMPGFKVITDLSQLEYMELDAHKNIDNIMDLCNQCGVSRVIRVITKNSNDIGFNIMSLFHYPHSVIIQTCESLEEAEHILTENL